MNRDWTVVLITLGVAAIVIAVLTALMYATIVSIANGDYFLGAMGATILWLMKVSK